MKYIVLFVATVECVLGFELGTFNTYQFGFNPFREALQPTQIQQIATSGIDVFCLQELYSPSVSIGYTSALKQLYPYSFTMVDVLSEHDPSKLDLPRIPCSMSQLQTFLTSDNDCSLTNCGALYESGKPAEATECLIENECFAAYDAVMYTECLGCVAASIAILPEGTSLDNAAGFCAGLVPEFAAYGLDNIYLNLTDGSNIISKNEILKTWSFILPSDLFISRRVNIAQIDICDVSRVGADSSDSSDSSDSQEKPCSDSIIVGCTHFHTTGQQDDTYLNLPPYITDADDISSNVGINRVQTEYTMDNVFNDDILTTLGLENEKDDIYGVFLLGDTNTGQLFDRCSYPTLNGNDCVQGSPTFNLWADNDIIDAPDLKFSDDVKREPLCTHCLDQTKSDYNPLSFDFTNEFINDPTSSRELDHIFVQDGYCANFKVNDFDRIFMEKIVTLPEPYNTLYGITPSSDHYGLVLEIEFKNNKGGRKKKNKGRCTKKKINIDNLIPFFVVFLFLC